MFYLLLSMRRVSIFGGSGRRQWARLTRGADSDEESQRRVAFAAAAEEARRTTIRESADPLRTQQILESLDGVRDVRMADTFAEKASKLMLFSAAPDVPSSTRLVHLCANSTVV